MKIVTPRMLSDKTIELIEYKYNAKYLIDSCLKTKRGYYADQPVAFFYTPEKHSNGSNFFGIYFSNEKFMITDGHDIVNQKIIGIANEDGEVIHSRYVHDFVTHKGLSIDGGLEYNSFLYQEGQYFKQVLIKISNQGEITIKD